MEILILIPLVLLALLFWAVVGVAALRRRVASLEDQVDRLRRGMAVQPVSPAAESASGTAPAGDSPLATWLRRRAEERGATVSDAVPSPVTEPPPVVTPRPPGTPGVRPSLGPGSGRPSWEGVSPARVPEPVTVGGRGEPVPVTKGPIAAWIGQGGIQWEQFMGVKLFAWIGGLALFLAVAFFVKHSFDQGWVSPQLRVAGGFLIGLGLLAGGVLLRRREYAVTAHALCGSGIVILYAASFAAHAYYELIGNATAFLLMVLVTTTAFLLAARLPAMVVAVLGLLGGFLTPPLLSTGVDNPVGLFGYVAILDIGLVAVALNRRWYFLVALAALGTVLMQLGWAAKFFEPDKAGILLGVLALFNGLFLAAALHGQRRGQGNDWMTGSAVALSFMTFVFTLWLLGDPAIARRPGLLFAFLLAADLPLLALAWKAPPKYSVAQFAAGGAAFLVLAIWTVGPLTVDLLGWALGGYLLFAALHTAFPIALARLRPGGAPLWLGHLFPPLALLLVLLPMAGDLTMPWLMWPVLLLVNGLAIGLALLTGAVIGVLVMVLLTGAVTAGWLLTAAADLAVLPGFLVAVGGFALLFFLVGLGFGERMRVQWEKTTAGGEGGAALPAWLGGWSGHPTSVAQVPAVSAILPFLLLILAVEQLPLTNPTPVFGLGLGLVAMMLVLARRLDFDILLPVGLGCVLALESVWHVSRFTPAMAGITVTWYVGFPLLFLAFPFCFRAALADRHLPWATAALAGPLHFFLVHRAVKLAWPNEVMGLLPAAFAVPMLLALARVARCGHPDDPGRLRLLAWFGGSALFFITLIFPVQFDRQWLTVGWALEGLALLWLFHRVPHPGLRTVGVALLMVAFTRLALNPAVFDYHPPGGPRIWNWYLYTYGIVTACLIGGARLLAPPRHRVFHWDIPPVLYALGGLLAFLLLNIQIADWFSEGSRLVFRFNASFGQDMTYSIAWGLFAFLLMTIGFRNRSRAVRYAGMGLLVVTIVKLFLHDLWRLGGLYRIGSLIGLAVVLMVVSFIYQRFLSGKAAGKAEDAAPENEASAATAGSTRNGASP